MKYVEFTVNRGDDGIVSGFSLMANETAAECYCVSFVTAQKRGNATVGFENGRIIFNHGGIGLEEAEDDAYGIYAISEGGTHEAVVSPEDEAALKNLLALRGPYAGKRLHVRVELAWGKGFTLSVK